MAENKPLNAFTTDDKSQTSGNKTSEKKPKQKPDSDRSRAVNELIRALLAIFVTAVFSAVPVALFALSGAIEFKMQFGYLLLLFLF